MKITNLKSLYMACMGLLALLVVFTPLLITDGISIVGEELLESITIGFLFLVGFVLNRIYEKELRRNESYLQEAWRHIGEINIITEAFKDSTTAVDRYPENKKEMRELIASIAEKILGAVNSPAVMLRILMPNEVKTLSEYSQSRTGVDPEIRVSDKQLIENKNHADFEVIASSIRNAEIQTYCILPKIDINPEQKIFIQKMLNELTMHYTIFDSKFCKK